MNFPKKISSYVTHAVTVAFALLSGAAATQEVTAQKPAPSPPTVNAKIVNSAAEPVPVSGTVNVTNAGSTPLVVRDADRVSRTIFQRQFELVMEPGQSTIEASFPLPDGKLLAIDYASATTVQIPGQIFNLLQVEDSSTAFKHFIDWKCNPSINCTASGPVRMYAGGSLALRAGRFGSSFQAIVLISVSGHLVDAPSPNPTPN